MKTRILLLLALAGPALAELPPAASAPASAAATGTISIVAPPPAPLPRDCDVCGKSRPIKSSAQWERDHALAHHITDVLIRTEGRRITTDGGDMRGVVVLLKTQIKALKLADPKSMAWEVADEAIKTLEIVVLRLENVEGELKREREKPREATRK